MKEKIYALKTQLIDQGIELTKQINGSIYFAQSEKDELTKTALKNLRDQLEIAGSMEYHGETDAYGYPTSPNWNQPTA